jgi:hypothetical protein
MISGRDFDIVTKELDLTLEQKQEELELMGKMGKIKPESLHLPSQTWHKNLNEYKNISAELEEKLASYAEQREKVMEVQSRITKQHKKGPRITTNYGTVQDTRPPVHGLGPVDVTRIAKVYEDCEFDENYEIEAMAKRDLLQTLEQEKWEREAEACTFAPKINEQSAKIANVPSRKPIYERWKEEARLKKQKILDQKAAKFIEKEIEMARMNPQIKHSVLRAKHDIYQSNNKWFDEKEKKLFDFKVQAYDKIMDDCQFEPKINKNFNETLVLGDFLSRQSNHTRKLDQNTNKLRERNDGCTFKPKLCTNSLKIAERGKETAIESDRFGFEDYENHNRHLSNCNYGTKPLDPNSYKSNLPKCKELLTEKDTTTRKKRDPDTFLRLTRSKKDETRKVQVIGLPSAGNRSKANFETSNAMSNAMSSNVMMPETAGKNKEPRTDAETSDKFSYINVMGGSADNGRYRTINTVECEHVPGYLDTHLR